MHEVSTLLDNGIYFKYIYNGTSVVVLLFKRLDFESKKVLLGFRTKF
jgi:hypothetical protein